MEISQKIKKSVLMDGIVCRLRDAKTILKGNIPEIFGTLACIICATSLGANIYKNHVIEKQNLISASVQEKQISNSLITAYLSSKPVEFVYNERIGNTITEVKTLFQNFSGMTDRTRAYLVKKAVVGDYVNHYGYIVFQSEKVSFNSKGGAFVHSTKITEVGVNLSNEGNLFLSKQNISDIEEALMILFNFEYPKAKRVAEIIGEEGFYQNRSAKTTMSDVDTETRKLVAEKTNSIFNLGVEPSENIIEFESRVQQAVWNGAYLNNEIDLQVLTLLKNTLDKGTKAQKSEEEISNKP